MQKINQTKPARRLLSKRELVEFLPHLAEVVVVNRLLHLGNNTDDLCTNYSLFMIHICIYMYLHIYALY